MVAAEKRYDYQAYYPDYVPDMKPEKKPKKNKKKKSAASVHAVRDRLFAMLFLTVCGAVLVGVVASAAYASHITYNINSIEKEIEVLQGEIDNLYVEIRLQSSIAIIEQKATQELGMVKPTYNDYVYITDLQIPQGDFALALKEQAYNPPGNDII